MELECFECPKCFGCSECSEYPECFECFECFDPFTHNVWVGKLNLLVVKCDFYEMIITRKQASFHVIVAKHSFGAVICIPHIGICCEFIALSDVSGNQRSLSRHIADVDAITISTALSCLSEFHDFYD